MRSSDWRSDVCSSDYNALRRLGSGWAVFVEAQRVPALDYPESTFPDPVSALVDMERGEQFREAGSHFESGYYLTLLWMPPAEEAARAENWLYEGRSGSAVDPHEQLAGFIDRSEEHTSELQSLMRISYAVFCLKTKNTHH